MVLFLCSPGSMLGIGRLKGNSSWVKRRRFAPSTFRISADFADVKRASILQRPKGLMHARNMRGLYIQTDLYIQAIYMQACIYTPIAHMQTWAAKGACRQQIERGK